MGILKELEQHILPAQQLNIDGVPSASLAILEDGEISSHVITNGNEDHNTIYQACSISKAITALAVARLIDQGYLTYETKVVDHLPQSNVDCLVDSTTAHQIDHVTVGMLLSHTSGLSQHGFPGYVGELPSVEDIFAGRPPSNTPKMYFMTFPGAQYSYSGGGFTVLQVVLENITEMPFSEIMKRTVLQPLGMGRSWYGTRPLEENNYAKAHATAYTRHPCAAEHHNFVELAAAGLWTTPTDLLKAVSAIQDSLYTKYGFLNQDTARKMLEQVDSTGDEGGMALGWAVTNNVFAHAGGNDPGYNTYVFGFRDREADSGKSEMKRQQLRSGIAVMVNSSLGHDVAIRKIVSALFYLKGWSRFKNLPSYFGADDYVPYAAPEGRAIDESWKEWIGEWEGGWQMLDQHGPKVKYETMDAMRLRSAAAPTKVFDDGSREVFLVVDGLQIGMRLTWKDGKRVVELLQDEPKTLKRQGE